MAISTSSECSQQHVEAFLRLHPSHRYHRKGLRLADGFRTKLPSDRIWNDMHSVAFYDLAGPADGGRGKHYQGSRPWIQQSSQTTSDSSDRILRRINMLFDHDRHLQSDRRQKNSYVSYIQKADNHIRIER